MICLKLCQKALQSSTSSRNLGTIKGIVRNTKSRGRCFEAEVFGETVQVPFEFLKTLGIFEYFTENGEAQLTIIHLSFLEFATAASLCRPGLDLQRELKKTTDGERFKAVVVYLAGLFVSNSGVFFLEQCKGLCQNFLHLMQNDRRNESIQEMFLSIMQREGKLTEVHTKGGEKFKFTPEKAALLSEAASAAGRGVNLDVEEVTMKEVKDDDWEKAVKVFKIFNWKMEDLGSGEGGGERSKVKVEASSLKIEKGFCKEENLVIAMKVLRAFSSWQMEELTLGDYGASWMSKVRGETDDRLHSEKVVCRTSDAVSLLCKMLHNCSQWNLGELQLDYYSLNWKMTRKHWSELAAVATKGRIDKVRVWKMDIQEGRREDVEAVKKITQRWCELDGQPHS